MGLLKFLRYSILYPSGAIVHEMSFQAFQPIQLHAYFHRYIPKLATMKHLCTFCCNGHDLRNVRFCPQILFRKLDRSFCICLSFPQSGLLTLILHRRKRCKFFLRFFAISQKFFRKSGRQKFFSSIGIELLLFLD